MKKRGLDVLGSPALRKEGWVRRFLAAPDRQEEASQLYEEMGFEVRIEHIKPDDFGDQCTDCASVVCDSYVVIYTREKERT